MNKPDTLLELLDLYLLVPIGLITVLCTLGSLCWRERQKRINNQPIFIILNDLQDNKHYRISGNILRQDLTRGEIRGVLSLYSNGRFDLDALRTEAFSNNIRYLKANHKLRTLHIPLNPDERHQFKLETLEIWHPNTTENA